MGNKAEFLRSVAPGQPTTLGPPRHSAMETGTCKPTDFPASWKNHIWIKNNPLLLKKIFKIMAGHKTKLSRVNFSLEEWRFSRNSENDHAWDPEKHTWSFPSNLQNMTVDLYLSTHLVWYIIIWDMVSDGGLRTMVLVSNGMWFSGVCFLQWLPLERYQHLLGGTDSNFHLENSNTSKIMNPHLSLFFTEVKRLVRSDTKIID